MGVDTSYAGQRPHLEAMWKRMKVKTDWDLKARQAAKTIFANKAKYQAVVQGTAVPWYVIGLIHMRESSFNFKTHLHNGDPLSKRTVQVPAGRPKSGKPPFTWEFSAKDAMRYDGLDTITDWSIPHMAYELECFNGKGYMFKDKPSPYLWSGSDQYKSGKYVKDGVYDPAAIDKQLGCMPVLKYVLEAEGATGRSVKLPPEPTFGQVLVALWRWWYAKR
jgi:lysozyme family protein